MAATEQSSPFVFTIANAAGLVGWSLGFLILLSQSTGLFSDRTDALFEPSPSGRLPIIDGLLLLEVICFTEVGRIAIGQLRGNLILGVVLHSIRTACLLLVLPDGLAGGATFVSATVLYSWSLTEVARYPMYLFPSSAVARKVRMVVPLFTFPPGAAAEALGAYRAIAKMTSAGEYDYFAVFLLGAVVFVNGVLGPTLAYPALLKKGVPVLLGKERRKKAD